MNWCPPLVPVEQSSTLYFDDDYSIGSSIADNITSSILIQVTNMAAIVVDLPTPVGPVIKISPLGWSIKSLQIEAVPIHRLMAL